jgi:single-strand DNA-binding protein
MAGSVNKVILVGNVGRDPEIRTTQNGGRIANLSVATSESWKDKATGERKENTQWHRVVIFNDALVGVVERFVKKGSKLYLEGQLETRKWTNDEGKDNYSTEVILRPYRGELTILDSRQGEGGGAAPRNASEPSYTAPSSGGSTSDYAADLDDDIPF